MALEAECVMQAELRSILMLILTFSFVLTATGHQTPPVQAWSETGHMIVASRAARLLPQPWPSFFDYYELLVNQTAVYPDSIYKNADPNEDPRHFIDLEVWDPKKPETGTLPFAVEQYAAEMTQAIKARDWNQMFIASGRVAHYAVDIHQPYHATVNYNPSTKTGSSLHGLLDSSIENHLTEFKLVGPGVGPLPPIQNLTEFMFSVARQSHSLLPTINRTLIDEGKSWTPELTKIIEDRTNTAIVSLARVWFTAILNAGGHPPSIPSPNRLSINIETSPQQVDPEKAFSVIFTVTDSLGVRTILSPKATVGSIPVDVSDARSLQVPYGRYVAILQPDTLKKFSGASLSLNLIAERTGYEPATGQFQIQVSQTQAQTGVLQLPLPAGMAGIIVLVIVVVVGIGAAVVMLRRKKS